eukprot:c9500_g1_i1.p1 GENE.c9500_g1_i1~~c9500_g1_i1.p1  ORF type:complete len:202 (-),score=8.20 c9500_g1_i1:40-645(-)
MNAIVGIAGSTFTVPQLRLPGVGLGAIVGLRFEGRVPSDSIEVTTNNNTCLGTIQDPLTNEVVLPPIAVRCKSSTRTCWLEVYAELPGQPLRVPLFCVQCVASKTFRKNFPGYQGQNFVRLDERADQKLVESIPSNFRTVPFNRNYAYNESPTQGSTLAPLMSSLFEEDTLDHHRSSGRSRASVWARLRSTCRRLLRWIRL